MRKIRLIALLLIGYCLFSCKEDSADKLQIRPFNDHTKVDVLLSKIADSPQILYAHSDKVTRIIGASGTIIHVDPSKLETIDGSMISDSIKIELLELSEMYSFITNNTQTISDGNLLVSGGAYYFNMTSGNKQLRIKKNEGLDIEFPILSDDEMDLFIGERDSLGQINWKSTNKKFEEKEIDLLLEPELPNESEPSLIVYESSQGGIFSAEEEDGLSSIEEPKILEKENVSDSVYKVYLEKKAIYDRKIKENKIKRRTYSAISIMNFGWINVDRFYKITSPLINLELIIQNDSITNARFFTIFKDMKSVLTNYYSKNAEKKTLIRNIPADLDIQIIGLAIIDSIPYMFKKEITTKEDQSILVDFKKSDQKEIEKNIRAIN